MGNFISLIIDILNTPVNTPTPTPSVNSPVTPSITPSPTQKVSAQIQEIMSGIDEDERVGILEEAQKFDPSVPLPTTPVTDALLSLYEDNKEYFVGNYNYLENTRTNKMSQGIFNRNTDSIILGPNTFSK
tara:strand:- start:1259 stop:1648 length:390 start_codon:yes stop_codon:yes gene_type:complete